MTKVFVVLLILLPFLASAEQNMDRFAVQDSLENELRIAEEKKDIGGQIETLRILSRYLQGKMADYDHAYEHWSKLEKLLDTHTEYNNNNSVRREVYSSLGWLLEYQNKYESSLAYRIKALELAQQLGDEHSIFSCRVEIASTNSLLGNWKKAMADLEELLSQVPKDQIYKTGRVHERLCNLHLKEGNIELALKHSLLSLNYDMGPHVNSFCYSLVANCYFNLHQLDSALTYGLKGLDIAQNNDLPKESYNAHAILKEIYKAQGMHEKALYHFVRFNEMREKQHSFETAQNIADFDANIEREREAREALITEQAITKKNRLLTSLFIGLGAISLILIIIIRQRNKIKEEKKKSESLLLNILPAKVAEELKAKGSADAQLIDQVTVLFTDFKGFTAMTEQMSPHDLVSELNICFSEFDVIMSKYGIEKIKTIGDSYMAAGGLPTPNNTHAKDVIQAAFEIRDFIENGKAEKIAAGLPYFEIRIGIHTGPVVAGIVGLKKFSYDIWGDTVNTSSRMEAGGTVGKVNISQTTYDIVKNDPELNFESRGKIAAKGKGEIAMFFVEQTQPRS